MDTSRTLEYREERELTLARCVKQFMMTKANDPEARMWFEYRTYHCYIQGTKPDDPYFWLHWTNGCMGHSFKKTDLDRIPKDVSHSLDSIDMMLGPRLAVQLEPGFRQLPVDERIRRTEGLEWSYRDNRGQDRRPKNYIKEVTEMLTFLEERDKDYKGLPPLEDLE